ncbi:MAG: TlpA disulfide reductase family protein, partial [Bacteroidales bacterium]|nr:TlpA disulfide reductase family protein [Bacteroidales bacterium]
MKQLLVLFLLLTTGLHVAHSQTLNLDLGDKFEYRVSSYNNETRQNTRKDTRLYESYSMSSYQLEVQEVIGNDYSLICNYSLTNSYTHQKPFGEYQWQTTSCNHKELHNKKTIADQFEDLQFRLQLSQQGEIKKIELLKYPINPNYKTQKEDITRIHKTLLQKYFFKFPKEYIVNEGFKANETSFMVDSLDKNQVYLSYHSDIELDEKVYEGEIQTEGKVIIDRKKGYVKELMTITNQDIISDNKKHEPYTSYHINRGVNITSTQTPFTCQYLEDGKKSKITFDSTNVCIRGHINHPDQKREVYLQWFKREPSAFKRMGVIVPLQEDNTFEIRVHIDKLQHVFLAHNERAELCIMPGDDLFINLDMHAFDESIRASGVGADHVNLCFDKFLFEEKNQCSSRELGQKLYDTDEYTNPEPVVASYLATLKLKQDFLLSGSKMVSPEVLLALFWDNQLHMLQSIDSYYSAISHDRRKKELQPYKRNRFSFVHYDSLIHPDKDLMAFSQEYDSFIRAFGFFALKNKMTNESGNGHIVLVNNFYDHISINNYNFAHIFFTGKTQESLKYSSINDCMKQGSWKGYEELLIKYKEEYPDSKRLAMLEETYNKSKKVSPGAPAYNFKLDDLAGNSHQLSDYKGKAVYLHFWSLGCGTDGGTQRNLNKLHEAYQDSNLVIIHILTDGNNEQARAYIEKHKQRGVFLIAEGQTDILLRREYFFNAVPHFCLIDINGNFVSSKEVDAYQLLQDPKPLSDALHPMSLLVNFQQRAKLMTIISLALLILLV